MGNNKNNNISEVAQFRDTRGNYRGCSDKVGPTFPRLVPQSFFSHDFYLVPGEFHSLLIIYKILVDFTEGESLPDTFYLLLTTLFLFT